MGSIVSISAPIFRKLGLRESLEEFRESQAVAWATQESNPIDQI